MTAAKPIKVYLEIGQSKTFAVSLDWPGWCRSGRDEEAALQALCDYGPRYADVLRSTSLKFHPPSDVSSLKVVERLEGNATTDFGAPDRSLETDTKPIKPAELKRWQTILQACWQAFDAAVEAAGETPLEKGPRGGGRDLAKIIQHVHEVDTSYLKALGGTLDVDDKTEPSEALTSMREAILSSLTAAAHGEIPPKGPRGGLRWTPRYFVRRLAWHELDHAWEIEDRSHS